MVSLHWNYRTAFLRCALLVAVGTTLHFVAGPASGGILHYPWSLVLAINYVYLLVVAWSYSGRYRWLRTLWDGKACVSSASVLLFLVLLSGLFRQDGDTDGLAGRLGIREMRSAWAFILVLFYFMTALGIRAVSEIAALFRIAPAQVPAAGASSIPYVFRKLSVACIHTGVFIVLAAGMFGSGDKIRCRLTAHQGVPEGMAVTDEGKRTGLPFTVLLKEFSIDEYPPKLFVRDMRSGTLSEEFLSAGSRGAETAIDGWTFSADSVLDMAGRLPGSPDYTAMEHVGAVPAVYVSAENGATGESRSGWVSCGSHIFAASVLDLGNGRAVVMQYPEARRYLSKVTLTGRDGRNRDVDIEVNHPARMGSWRIYQSGYDTAKGKWSTVSVLECVKDPWYGVIQAALWMILAGGVAMSVVAGSGKLQSGRTVMPFTGDKGKKEGGI